MNNIFKLLHTFLLQNGYFGLSYDDLRLQLLSHPDCPSFKAISDTLDYFGVENLAVEVPWSALGQLPEVFFSLVLWQGREELAVVRKKKEGLKVEGKDFKLSFTKPEFLKHWKGQVIVVQALHGNKKPQRPYVLSGILVAYLMFCMLPLFNGSLAPGLYLLLSGAGLGIALLLVRQVMGITDPLVRKVCNSVGSDAGCQSVLGSESAKILGIFSLLEGALAFFTAQIVMVFFAGYNGGGLLLFALSALPILAYSVYSQWLLIRKWCALCLGVSATVIVQLAVLSANAGTSVSGDSLAYLARLMLAFGLLYLLVMHMIGDKAALNAKRDSEVKLLGFKRNPDVFKTFLTHSGPALQDLPTVDQFAFGSTSPSLSLLAVTNPFCGFCSRSFATYYKLLQRYPDDLKITFVFLAPYQDAAHPAVKIINTVHSAYYEEGQGRALELMREWYSDRSSENWQKYEAYTGGLIGVGPLLEQHALWCRDANIDYTPATFVNGHPYPKAYEIEDLELIVKELMEHPPIERKLTAGALL